MKRIIIIITTIFMLVLMGAYLAFKLYMTDYYNLDNLKNYETYYKSLNVKNTINVKHEDVLDENKIIFKDISIRNDFNTFTKLGEPHSTENYVKYVLYDENNEGIASIWFATDYSLVESYKEEVVVFNSEEIRYEQMSFKEFFEKKEIKDDINLINYLTETKDKTNTIFDSIEDMKSNYILHYLFSMGFEHDGFTLIEGDLKGYMKEYKIGDVSMIEIHLMSDNKLYGMTLINREYFTDEYILDLLNTIEIK